MRDIEPGDVSFASTLTLVGNRIEWKINAVRGKRFILLLLGAVKKGQEMNVPTDRLLNALGWVYDPEAAEKELVRTAPPPASEDHE